MSFLRSNPDKAFTLGEIVDGLVVREIAMKHPLVNGNKRLAFALGVLLLRNGGYELTANLDETTNLVLSVARGELTEKELVPWLRSKSKKT